MKDPETSTLKEFRNLEAGHQLQPWDLGVQEVEARCRELKTILD